MSGRSRWGLQRNLGPAAAAHRGCSPPLPVALCSSVICRSSACLPACLQEEPDPDFPGAERGAGAAAHGAEDRRHRGDHEPDARQVGPPQLLLLLVCAAGVSAGAACVVGTPEALGVGPVGHWAAPLTPAVWLTTVPDLPITPLQLTSIDPQVCARRL